MAKIHRGATLTPHFREFLPPWVARQPWYVGDGGGGDPARVRAPGLRPVGYFRMEDPAGVVGIETHLIRAGSVLYQVPMTYLGAPLEGAEAALISTTEHSVLGTRWIYDAVADPVWVQQLLGLVGGGGAEGQGEGGVSEPSLKPGVGPAEARGRWMGTGVPDPETVEIELKRILVGGGGESAAAAVPEPGGGVVGVVMGSWHPDGPDSPAVKGCLAVLRERRDERAD